MALRGGSPEKVRKMVEVALRGLGADPEHAALGPDQWLVKKGSAHAVVRLVASAEADKPAHLQVVSPVMKAPEHPAFRERLLRFNHDMSGLACFTLTPQNEIHLLASRTTDGISPEEIARVIAHVAHFSDLYDDQLLQEFGRSLAIAPPKTVSQRPPAAAAPAQPPPAEKPKRRFGRGA